jgi:hypothetical protein
VPVIWRDSFNRKGGSSCVPVDQLVLSRWRETRLPEMLPQRRQPKMRMPQMPLQLAGPSDPTF